MQSKIILILSLLCLSTCKALPEITKWNLTVTAEDGSPNIFVVQGKYTPLLLTLTQQDSETNTNREQRVVPSETTIELTGNDAKDFQTTQKNYLIDTSESNTYVVYLGVSCKTDLAEGDYVLSFKSTDKTEFITFISFTVQFIKNPVQNVIDITPVLTELPPYSKAFFKFNSELTNVDDIKVKFTTTEKGLSYVKDLEIKPFNEQSGSFIEQGYDQYIGDYGVNEYVNGSSLHTYTLQIENECYTALENTFEFSTVNQIIAPLDKRTVMKSFHQIESTDEDAIEVSFDVPANVTLIAALSSDEKLIEDKTALKMEENEKVQYSKYFITEYQDNFVLKFSNLKKRTKYKLLILLRTLDKDDDNNYISIKVGHFKGADIVKNLYPRSVNDFPAQCATWTFENEVPKKFSKKAKQYCTYVFSGIATNEKDFFKGCTKCQEIKSVNDNPNQAVVCVYNKEKCKHQFGGDSITLFKSFVDDLSTAEKINATLSIQTSLVKECQIEIDNNEPNKEQITVALAKKAVDKRLTFNVTSTLTQTIECNYKKNLNRLVRKRWISPENLKERSLVIPPGETKEFEAMLPNNKHDNRTYNIYLDCYYLPNFDHQFFSTGPFVAGTFLFTDLDEPQMSEPDAIDCSLSKNADEIQCINQEPLNTNITFESNIPEVYETALDDADDLARLSVGNQYIMLSYAMANFQKANSEIEVKASASAILNAIEKALEIVSEMKQFNCTVMNFEECRKFKKGYQMQIVNIFKNFIKCDNIIQMFSEFKEKNSLEDAFKSFLLLIKTATANYDSMNKDDTNTYIELVDCVMNNFDNIFILFNQTSTKTEEELQIIKADLIQMLLDAIANLGEANKYDDYDGYNKQPKSKGQLMVNEKTKKIKTNLKKTAKMLWGKGPGKWETDNMIVNLTTKVEGQSTDITYFEIPEYGIKVGLYVNALMNEFNAKYAEIIMYKKYPLLSLTNDIVSPKFVSIVLYDESQNEIEVKDIPKDYLPLIEFEKTKNQFPKCVYYHEKDEQLKNDGVSAEEREGYVRCKVTHLTDFTLADSSALSGLQWWGILLICIAAVVVLAGVFLIWRKISVKGLKSNFTESLKA